MKGKSSRGGGKSVQSAGMRKQYSGSRLSKAGDRGILDKRPSSSGIGRAAKETMNEAIARKKRGK